MRKILLLNPNTSTTTTAMMVRLAEHYFQLHAPTQSVEVIGHTASSGPPMITTESELTHAALAIGSADTTSLARPYDGLMVAAFGDPGLDYLQQQLPDLPVVGIGQASMEAAADQGRRFGIATTTPDLAHSTQHQVARYGLEAWYTGIQLTELPPLTLAQHPKAQTEALARAVQQCLEKDQAEAVIIGGGPLGEAAAQLRTRFKAPVISPIEAACERLIQTWR